MSTNLLVSSSPHIRSKETISSVMRDVIIALTPATIMGVVIFGLTAAIEIAMCILSCILFESLYNMIAKKPNTTKDLSAVVTGLLLGLNLPTYSFNEHPIAIFVIPLVGSFFAIIIAKQLFGGLGQNFMNPALAGRAFLVASYPALMTGTIFKPTKFMPQIDVSTSATQLSNVDAYTYATPLATIKAGGTDQSLSLINGIIGNTGGTIGETCAILLILGGLYLISKKIISWRIPIMYISTVFILTTLFKFTGLASDRMPVEELFYGGLMLGAFYMATDYSSSPVTPTGQLIMGFGCGLLTVLIRIFGSYPEGVSYSILLMNLCVPLIDRWTKPRTFGHLKKAVAKEVK